MKKVIIVIAGLAVVLSAALYLKTSGLGGRLSPGKIMPAGETAGTAGETSSASMVNPAGSITGYAATIPAQILGYFRIQPRQADPAIDYLTRQMENVRRTKAWNKTHAEDQLKLQFESGFTGGDPVQSQDLQEFYAAIEIARPIWQALTDVSAVALEQTFSPAPNLEIPLIQIEANFTNSEASSQLRTLIDEKVLQGKTEINQNGRLVRENPELYRAEVPVDNGKIDVTLAVKPQQISLAIGTDKFDLFRTTDPSKSLAATDEWKKYGDVQDQASASNYYFRPDKFAAALTKISQSSPEMAREAAPAIASLSRAWSDVNGMSAGTWFTKGISHASCVNLKPGSTLAGAYEQYFSARNEGVSQFLSLINPRTVLAMRMMTNGFGGWLDTLRNFVPCDQADCALDLQHIANFKNSVERLGFKEVGIVANAPKGAPMPEVALYLGQGKFSERELLNELSSALTQVKALAGPQAEWFTPQLAAAADGQPVLKLTLGPPEAGYSAVAKVVNGNSIVLAMNEVLISEAEEELKAGKSTALGMDRLAGELGSSNYYLYATLSPAIPVVQPFLPMLLASQPPEMDPAERIHDDDISEVFKLISGTLVSFQKNAAHEGGAYCVTGRMLVF